jgi:hypothetical protein
LEIAETETGMSDRILASKEKRTRKLASMETTGVDVELPHAGRHWAMGKAEQDPMFETQVLVLPSEKWPE